MNLEKITELRDHLINNVEQESFDMEYWIGTEAGWWSTMAAPIPTISKFKKHECDTTACLAGHTLILNNKVQGTYHKSSEGIDEAAAEILGLCLSEQNHVFYAKWFDVANYIKSNLCKASNKKRLLGKLKFSPSHAAEDMIADAIHAITLKLAIAYLNKVIEQESIFVTVTPTENQAEIDDILEELY